MALQANELRIGNCIYFTGNGENNIVPVIELWAKELVFGYVGNAMCQFYNSENISPIPLTPEILEKCGFILNRNNEISIEINDIASHLELMSGAGGYYYPSFTQTPQGDEERSVYFNRITSLHQLQNLYFALTGEELIYKP